MSLIYYFSHFPDHCTVLLRGITLLFSNKVTTVSHGVFLRLVSGLEILFPFFFSFHSCFTVFLQFVGFLWLDLSVRWQLAPLAFVTVTSAWTTCVSLTFQMLCYPSLICFSFLQIWNAICCGPLFTSLPLSSIDLALIRTYKAYFFLIIWYIFFLLALFPKVALFIIYLSFSKTMKAAKPQWHFASWTSCIYLIFGCHWKGVFPFLVCLLIQNSTLICRFLDAF